MPARAPPARAARSWGRARQTRGRRVGQTARTMRGTGWRPITPLGDLDLPSGLGLRLGVFPTWETIGLQLASFAFVVGFSAIARGTLRRRLRRSAGAPAPEELLPSDDRELVEV